MSDGKVDNIGGLEVSQNSLFIMSQMADPTKVDMNKEEREDIENAPSIIQDRLKRDKERKRRTKRHTNEKSHKEITPRKERSRERESRYRSPLQTIPTIPEKISHSERKGPIEDIGEVIRGKSRSGHEESMMERALNEARKRSRVRSEVVQDNTHVIPKVHEDTKPTNNVHATKSDANTSTIFREKMAEARNRSRSMSVSISKRNEQSNRKDTHYEKSSQRDVRHEERSGYNQQHRNEKSSYKAVVDRDDSRDNRRDDRRDNRRDNRRDDRRDDRRDNYRDMGNYNTRTRESRAEEIEKKDYLIALEKLRHQGIRLTKEYTMSDSLVDIQYEFERHNMNLESIRKVETAKAYIQMAAGIIIVINHVAKKPLKLDGWTQSLASQLNEPKYFVPLEEVYRSIHKGSTPSPWMQIGTLLIMSIVTTHVSNWTGINNTSGGSGNGLGGLLGSLGGLNIGAMLGPIASMFGQGGKSGNVDGNNNGGPPKPVHITPSQRPNESNASNGHEIKQRTLRPIKH